MTPYNVVKATLGVETAWWNVPGVLANVLLAEFPFKKTNSQPACLYEMKL